MGKGRYSKAIEMINALKGREGHIVSFDTLKREIMIKIGGEAVRTVKPYIQFMIELNLIQELKNGAIRLR